MTDEGTPQGDEPGRGPDESTSWSRRIVPAISSVAAALSIVAYLVGWFSGPAPQPSSAAEYVAVCTLANTEQTKWERQLTQFRPEFEGARDPTKARNALLSLTELDIMNAAALWSAIDALTPPPAMAETQDTLLSAWSGSLSLLRSYRDHLSAVASSTELVSLTQSIPRSQIERDTTLARALLLRLGGLGCHLDEQALKPVTDWSQAFVSVPSHHRKGVGSSIQQTAEVPVPAESRSTASSVTPSVDVPAIAAPRPPPVVTSSKGILPAAVTPLAAEAAPVEKQDAGHSGGG
jgi:hypothetical protein